MPRVSPIRAEEVPGAGGEGRRPGGRRDARGDPAHTAVAEGEEGAAGRQRLRDGAVALLDRRLVLEGLAGDDVELRDARAEGFVELVAEPWPAVAVVVHVRVVGAGVVVGVAGGVVVDVGPPGVGVAVR